MLFIPLDVIIELKRFYDSFPENCVKDSFILVLKGK